MNPPCIQHPISYRANQFTLITVQYTSFHVPRFSALFFISVYRTFYAHKKTTHAHTHSYAFARSHYSLPATISGGDRSLYYLRSFVLFHSHVDISSRAGLVLSLRIVLVEHSTLLRGVLYYVSTVVILTYTDNHAILHTSKTNTRNH